MAKTHLKSLKNRVWRNTIGKHKTKPKQYFIPSTSKEVGEIIRKAENDNKRVRAIGSGHSFSNVAIVPDGNYLIDLRKFNGVSKIYKPDIDKEVLVKTGAGTSICKFNRALDNLGLSIVNMGGIDHQTISGAIATGTHGTGIDIPGLHGMVKAIHLITAAGDSLWLVPENCVFQDSLDTFEGAKIHRNNDDFNACLVSLGAMGIITEYLLKVRREYWMEEKKEVERWSMVKSDLKAGKRLKDQRGFMVQINPYSGFNKEDKKDHSCLVVTHTEIDVPQKISLASRMRNLLGTFAANVPVIRWIVYQVLLQRIKYNLIKIPKSLETSIKSQKDKSFINTARKVLYQGAEYVKERAYDCEVAFDLKDNTYIEVVDKLIELINTEISEKGLVITSPIGLRFVKASNAFLAPDYQKDICYVDTPMLLKAKGEVEVLNACLKLMVDNGGMPHWGKYNAYLQNKKEDLDQIYKGLSKWRAVVKKYNPKDTFTSSFMDDLDLLKKHELTV